MSTSVSIESSIHQRWLCTVWLFLHSFFTANLLPELLRKENQVDLRRRAVCIEEKRVGREFELKQRQLLLREKELSLKERKLELRER